MWALCTHQAKRPHRLHLWSLGGGGMPGKAPLQEEVGPSLGLAAGTTSAPPARRAEPPSHRAQSERPQLSRQLCSSLLSLTPDCSRPQLTQHGPRPPPRCAATSAHRLVQWPSRGLTTEQREHQSLCQGYTQP